MENLEIRSSSSFDRLDAPIGETTVARDPVVTAAQFSSRPDHLAMIDADRKHFVQCEDKTRTRQAPFQSHHGVQPDVPAMVKMHDIWFMPVEEVYEIRDALIVFPDFVNHIVVIDGENRFVAVDQLDSRGELIVRSYYRACQQHIDSVFAEEFAFALCRDFSAAEAVSRRRMCQDGNAWRGSSAQDIHSSSPLRNAASMCRSNCWKALSGQPRLEHGNA